MEIIRKIARNDYLKSVAAIGIVLLVIGGGYFGLCFALNVDVPVRVVESGSMCVTYNGSCDGGSHIFEPTLHVGDIIIIQGVDAKDINANYPNSDIIVYQNPTNPVATPIVHRVVESYEADGKLYFQTKGDGNPTMKWPNPVSKEEYDSNCIWRTGEGVSEDQVIGKVIMRIPWFGHITLFLRSNPWSLPVIIALILGLIVLEFILPIMKKKPQEPEIKIEPTGDLTYI
jgi:signal peptidase